MVRAMSGKRIDLGSCGELLNVPKRDARSSRSGSLDAMTTVVVVENEDGWFQNEASEVSRAAGEW